MEETNVTEKTQAGFSSHLAAYFRGLPEKEAYKM
jgi:hypothetical protein